MAEVVARAKIPVVVNGGINTPEDALFITRETRPAGLMIGRAAIGKPWFFKEVYDRLSSLSNNNDRLESLSYIEPLTVFTKHLERIVSHYASLKTKYPELITDPEKPAVRAFVTHLFRYFTGMPGANHIRRNMNSCRSAADVFRLLETC